MKGNMLKVLALRAKNRMMNRGNMEMPSIRVIENDDSEFVEKVRKILAEENLNKSPFKSLMDEKQIINLDEAGKERYLLETMEKYLKAKAQIEREEMYRA